MKDWDLSRSSGGTWLNMVSHQRAFEVETL